MYKFSSSLKCFNLYSLFSNIFQWTLWFYIFFIFGQLLWNHLEAGNSQFRSSFLLAWGRHYLYCQASFVFFFLIWSHLVSTPSFSSVLFAVFQIISLFERHPKMCCTASLLVSYLLWASSHCSITKFQDFFLLGINPSWLSVTTEVLWPLGTWWSSCHVPHTGQLQLWFSYLQYLFPLLWIWVDSYPLSATYRHWLREFVFTLLVAMWGF